MRRGHYPPYQPLEETRDELDNQEFIDDEIPEETYVDAPKSKTGAKRSKGKAIALTILVIGGVTVGSILATRAVNSIKETRRVDNLIANYTTENYVSLPSEIITNRAYDTTYADGEKVVDRLIDKNVEYININGQFYTRNGIDIAVITYKVKYESRTYSIVESHDGVKVYMPPRGYGFHDAPWRGEESAKVYYVERTVIVPADLDLSRASFPDALSWEIVKGPVVYQTLPYEVIRNSTLICDVPDNASLNENNECEATLNLAPKKH